jgi:hypothetical protein
VLALALAGCADTTKALTAEDVYTKAQEKENAADQVDVDMVIDMTMTLTDGTDTQDISFTMDASMRAQDANKETMAFEMPMTISIAQLGMTMSADIYYADGYYMIDVMGQKMKCRMDLADAVEQLQSSDMASLSSLDLLQDLTMTEQTAEDGKTKQYLLNYTMSPEALGDIYDQMLATLGMDDESAITWDTITGTLLVSEDFDVLAQTANAAFSMDVQGTAIACTMTMDSTYNEIGSDFALNIPDADDFEEVDASDLGLAS